MTNLNEKALEAAHDFCKNFWELSYKEGLVNDAITAYLEALPLPGDANKVMGGSLVRSIADDAPLTSVGTPPPPAKTSEDLDAEIRELIDMGLRPHLMGLGYEIAGNTIMCNIRPYLRTSEPVSLDALVLLTKDARREYRYGVANPRKLLQAVLQAAGVKCHE